MGTGRFDSGTGKFNLTINIDYVNRDPITHLPINPVTDTLLNTRWKPTFQKASELLYDATDGKHQLGIIQVCNSPSNLGEQVADVNLFVDQTGTSHAGGGYARLGPTPSPGFHLTIWKDIDERPLVIVHEFGHFIYGLHDENIVSPGTNGSCGGHNINTGAPLFITCIMEAERADGGQYAPLINTMTYLYAGNNPDHISRFCIDDPAPIVNANGTLSPHAGFHVFNNEQQVVQEQLNNTPLADKNKVSYSCWKTMTGPYPDLKSSTTPSGVDAIDWMLLDLTQSFVLVIDKSLSMLGNNKLMEAQFGAKWWADAIPFGDNLAVISFSDTASAVYPMNDITDPVDRTNVKNAIDSIVAQGSTSIGSGLLEARNQIVNSTLQSPTKVIVLLTDGRQNTDPSPYMTLPSGVKLLDDLHQRNIRVYTIGIGSDVDPILLGDIASKTGGTYYVAYP